MGISSPTKEEATSSGHLFLAVFPIHLTCWWGQVHAVLSEGVWERNELPTIATLKIKVSWVSMAFLCWVGGFYCSYSYIVSTILGSQTTLVSSKHISHFSFSCLMPHFQGLYLYIAAGSEKNRSTPSYPVWKWPSLLIIDAQGWTQSQKSLNSWRITWILHKQTGFNMTMRKRRRKNHSSLELTSSWYSASEKRDKNKPMSKQGTKVFPL